MAKSKVNRIDTKDLEKLAGLGLTEKQICFYYGISVQTFETYKKQYPLILESLKKGKFLADNKVVESLYRRACGITYKEKTKERKIIKYKFEEQEYLTKTGRVKKGMVKIPVYDLVVVKEVNKFIPPDVGATAFWLKNRLPDNWRERNQLEISSLMPDIPEPYASMSVDKLDELIKQYNEKYTKIKELIKDEA